MHCHRNSQSLTNGIAELSRGNVFNRNVGAGVVNSFVDLANTLIFVADVVTAGPSTTATPQPLVSQTGQYIPYVNTCTGANDTPACRAQTGIGYGTGVVGQTFIPTSWVSRLTTLRTVAGLGESAVIIGRADEAVNLAIQRAAAEATLPGGPRTMVNGAPTIAVERANELVVTRITAGDIPGIRARSGVASGDTIAAARTDIPGANTELFEGISGGLRNQNGLPSLDELHGPNRPIRANTDNAFLSRHAEEDAFNAVATRIDSLNLSPATLNGRTVNVVISNPTGVCSMCAAGLTNPNVLPGVVMQFSQRYPGLTIRISSTSGVARPGVATLVVRNGRIVGP